MELFLFHIPEEKEIARTRHVADMFAPFIALGYAIVRIGCFLNGCCYGEITVIWFLGVTFTYVDAFFPDILTQLYSSAFKLLMLFRLFDLAFTPDANLMEASIYFYILGYSGFYRFVVEFLGERR